MAGRSVRRAGAIHRSRMGGGVTSYNCITELSPRGFPLTSGSRTPANTAEDIRAPPTNAECLRASEPCRINIAHSGHQEGSNTCAFLLGTFEHLAERFGVPLVPKKTEGPTATITFLGLEIDSVKMECRLLRDKLEKLQEEVRGTRGKCKLTLHQLQSLLGKLNFACHIIPMGRVFCRRLSSVTAGVRSPTHFLSLNKEHREDLRVWHDFLEPFNGCALWMSGPVGNCDLELFTGFGAFFKGQWCAARWPPEWDEAGVLKNLVLLELFPIVVAMEIWGESFRNLKVRFNCDNMGVVQVINRLTVASVPVVRLLRHLVLSCLQWDRLLAVGTRDGATRGHLSQLDVEHSIGTAAKCIKQSMLGKIWLLVFIIQSVKTAKVCYDRLGCFSNEYPLSWTLQRPIPHLPWSPERINTRFLLYTRDSLSTYQEISAIQYKTIEESNFNTLQKTQFIIHGFLDNGEKSWMTEMCQAMLKMEDVNCICVDWHGGSMGLYTQASNNIRIVGAELAYFTKTLQNDFDYSPSNVHIIGHNLGAHAAGEAGKNHPEIGRITGLDPAQPYFQGTPTEVRLDSSDAKLVDVIHTDGAPPLINTDLGGFGMSQTVGHLDFFPNGGEHMPGCKQTEILKDGSVDQLTNVVDDMAACNHLRSYKYYTESILNPEGFMGYKASSYKAFQEGAGFPCPSNGCPTMGHFAEKYSGITLFTQKFYLNTREDKIFSSWRYKVTVRVKGDIIVSGSFAVSLEGSGGKTQEYKIQSGSIIPDMTYTAFINANIDVGSVNKVTFVWLEDLLKIKRLGASTVTVQSGKHGVIYTFNDNAKVAAGVSQVLTLI
ncbi:pancreatic lipase-related protein 2-like [Lithobates pipiens]